MSSLRNSEKMIEFRKQAPVRTCTRTSKNYRSFKADLASDFNRRCGYTDCSDLWFGGSGTFHIDHFKPHTQYPKIKTAYSNLVYSCSYVNIAKSDIDNPSFIDPCDHDYNKHFNRNSNGSIVPISSEARIMYHTLKLYLLRYQIIWMLDEIHKRMQMMSEINEKNPSLKAKELLAELVKHWIRYMEYLRSNQ